MHRAVGVFRSAGNVSDVTILRYRLRYEIGFETYVLRGNDPFTTRDMIEAIHLQRNHRAKAGAEHKGRCIFAIGSNIISSSNDRLRFLDRTKQMIDKVEFVGQIADYPTTLITMCRIGLVHIAPRPPLAEMLPDIAMRCVNCLSPQGVTQRNDDRMESQLIGDENFEWIWWGGFALVSEYRLFDKHAACKTESFQCIQAFAVT